MAATAAGPSTLDRRFGFAERRTTPRTEVLGGLSTFLTMSYILVVNPAILSAAKMPVVGVAVATALAAAIATAAMGLFTNLPFALAPGLGINAVVAFDIVVAQGHPWQVGMACIVIEGLLALVLVLAGLRETVVDAVPDSLKLSIGVGIGLFITLVGLQQGGIVVDDPATGISLGDLSAGPPLIALAGIFVAIAMMVRGMRGALLAGIAVSTALGLVFGVLDPPDKIADWPGPAGFSTIGDALVPSTLADALTLALVPTIFALFMTDFFDTIGSAMSVATAGGLTDRHGRLPRLRGDVGAGPAVPGVLRGRLAVGARVLSGGCRRSCRRLGGIASAR